MKVKRMVKSLVAVGAGAIMLGATAMGALAVDLGDYPTAFVDGTTFNGLYAIGEAAQPIDNIAMSDIATGMMVPGGEGTTSVSVEGDAWQVGTSAKFLEIADTDDSASSIAGEDINDMATFIGDDELGALMDGSWNTNENEYGYQQFLFFDSTSGTSELVKYSENDNDITADHFYIANGNQIARYKLEFTSTAQSDVTDSTGTADTTGLYLDDFEDTTINLMGKEYTIVQARRTSTSGGGVKLVLMAGATSDTLLEGESKTYTVNGKEYEVTLSYVDSTYAKFVVNGETTQKIADGGTFVLADKTEIGVSDVLYQGYAGGIHSSSFFLGAQKVELQDTDVTTATSPHELKVGSESIDGADVFITGTDDNSTFSISTIEINMTAQDDYFVGAGEKLSDVILATGDEKELLLANSFDIEYAGLSEEETHDLMLKTSSSRKYELHLFDGDGNAVDLPIAYAEAQYNMSLGSDSWSNTRTNQERLILNETSSIYKDDYFVLTAGNPADGSAKSYLLQYKGADDSDKTSPKIKFKNMGNSETLEYSVSTSGTIATIKLGGYSFPVYNASAHDAGDDFQLNVALNGDTDITDTAFITFVDSYGSEWTFSGYGDDGNSSSEDSWVWTQTTPNSDDYDNDAPADLALTITSASGPEVRAAYTLGGATNLVTPDGETEVAYGYTSMGTFVTFSEPSGDPDELTMAYPKEQRRPQVYVTSGATATATTVTGDLTPVTVVDAFKLDSEIASTEAQNLIVVGGPCVNTVAAELMGNPADCAAGFTPGKAIVRLWEHTNGNVAMLVAGYSGADTRLAGKYLAMKQADFQASCDGLMECEIEGTTYMDATVGAPVAMADTTADDTTVDDTTDDNTTG